MEWEHVAEGARFRVLLRIITVSEIALGRSLAADCADFLCSLFGHTVLGSAGALLKSIRAALLCRPAMPVM